MKTEIEELKEALHLANGTCDLAIKHRDAAEARVKELESECAATRREVESLRSALMDPPADVQEAVIKKLGLVSGEALDSANAQVESLRGERNLSLTQWQIKYADEVLRLDGELSELRNSQRLELLKLHTALQRAKVALELVQNKVLFLEGAKAVDAALAAIEECGI